MMHTTFSTEIILCYIFPEEGDCRKRMQSKQDTPHV